MGELAAPIAREIGFEPALPFVGRGGLRARGDTSVVLRDGPARFDLEWVAQAPGSEAKLFRQSLISSYVDLLFESLEGPGAFVEVRSSSALRAGLAIHDADLLPPFDRKDSELLAYIERVMAIVEESESVVPPRALLEKAFLDSFPGGDAT